VKYVLTVAVSVYGVQNLVIYTLAEWWHGPARLALSVARTFELKAGHSDDLGTGKRDYASKP